MMEPRRPRITRSVYVVVGGLIILAVAGAVIWILVTL